MWKKWKEGRNYQLVMEKRGHSFSSGVCDDQTSLCTCCVSVSGVSVWLLSVGVCLCLYDLFLLYLSIQTPRKTFWLRYSKSERFPMSKNFLWSIHDTTSCSLQMHQSSEDKYRRARDFFCFEKQGTRLATRGDEPYRLFIETWYCRLLGATTSKVRLWTNTHAHTTAMNTPLGTRTVQQMTGVQTKISRRGTCTLTDIPHGSSLLHMGCLYTSVRTK